MQVMVSLINISLPFLNATCHVQKALVHLGKCTPCRAFIKDSVIKFSTPPHGEQCCHHRCDDPLQSINHEINIDWGGKGKLKKKK